MSGRRVRAYMGIAIVLAVAAGTVVMAQQSVMSGEIAGVDSKAGTLTLTHDSGEGSEDVEFTVSRTVEVTINGESAGFGSVRVGDSADVTYEERQDGSKLATQIDVTR